MGLLDLFRSDERTAESDPRQDTTDEVLMMGDHIHAFTAEQKVRAREAVKLSGGRSVAPCDDITEHYGIALYDAAEGEEIAVVERPAMVCVRAGEDIEPNEGVELATSTEWAPSKNRERAIAHTRAKAGEYVEVELRP